MLLKDILVKTRLKLVPCQDKELNEMLFFFQISALKILAVATAMTAFFALIFEKITAIVI